MYSVLLRSSRTAIAAGLILAVPATPAVLAAQASHAHPAPAAGSEEARVVATIQALFAAAERNDLAALDTLYAGDSLTIVEGAGINRGWADYRDHHLAPEMKEMKNFRYRPFEIEARVAGPLAWAIFRYGLVATMGERAVDVVGRGTAILERDRRGVWRIRHTQTSGRARRPADPPLP